MNEKNKFPNQNDSKGNTEDNRINKYLAHKPLSLKKRFYLSEFLAENVIRLVAFISIGAIIAIFYYVFQESFYAFKPIEKKTNNELQMGSDSEVKSETYQSESYSPEPYANESIQKNEEEFIPETYGSETTELKPEGYSVDGNEIENSQTSVGAENEEIASVEGEHLDRPVKIKELIAPNDVIDNKPAYIWQPISENPKYSFVPLFVGALKVTLIGILIAAPIGILAAIFTVAFAPRWMKEIIKPAIEILAGFPSVVIGFFALITLATIIQEVFDTTYRLNAFVGGIGMALAVIPIIYTVTEDALSAVPKYMKEASLALGSNRWQTAWRVMLPAATPGVFAAIILGFGRAFGETMIALMATGNAALVSPDIFESVRTMAATIGAEMAEVEFRGHHYGVLFLIGAVLFVVTFSLNAIAEFYVRNKLMKKFQGK